MRNVLVKGKAGTHFRIMFLENRNPYTYLISRRLFQTLSKFLFDLFVECWNYLRQNKFFLPIGLIDDKYEI